MKKQNDMRTQLLTQNPWKLMLSLSLPAIIGMVVIGLYNFMDAVFVGNMIGSDAMTAVKIAYPFTLVNNGIATLIGVGSASVLSRAIGNRDDATIGKIMGNLVVCVTTLSVIVTVVGMVFTRQILSLAGAEGQIMEYAVRYLRIIFLGSLFVNFAQAANMVMRGEGIMKKAMLIMGSGAVINIILDPIMIAICDSVEGAAYATIIAQFLQAAATLWYFLKKSRKIRIGRLVADKRILGEVLSVGVSAMLMQVMQLVQQTVMYNVAENYGGSQWQTVLGAALSLQAFAFIPLWGVSQGFQPAAGTNFGAKSYARVKKLMGVFVKGSTLLSLVFYLPVMIAPKFMLNLLIPDNAALVETGAGSLRLFFSTYITFGALIMSITLFQAIGQGKKAAILTLLRQLVCFVPMVLLVPRLLPVKQSVKGVFLAPVITDVIVLLLAIGMVTVTFRAFDKNKETRVKKMAG